MIGDCTKRDWCGAWQRIACGAALFLVAFGGTAHGQPRIGVGFYAPELPLASQTDGFRFINRLAAHLKQATGIAVEGRAYRRTADLERDVRRGVVHLAVLGGFYVASSGRTGRVIAEAKPRGTPLRWSIMAQGKRMKDLKGATLQIAKVGRLALPSIQHALFGGQVDPRVYFKIRRSPNLASAVAALKLGRAAAVFAPTSSAGLRPAIGGVTVPGPAVVVLAKLPAAQLAQVKRAVATYRGRLTAHYAGFALRGGSAYADLRQRCTPRQLKMVVSPLRPRRLAVTDIFAPQSVRRPLKPLNLALWQPQRREE